MKIAKYKYIGTCDIPGYGSIGEAMPALGCDDPSSVEFGAWLFVPDWDTSDPEGEREGYYVDPDHDLILHHYDVSGCTDSQRFAMDMQSDPGALGF